MQRKHIQSRIAIGLVVLALVAVAWRALFGNPLCDQILASQTDRHFDVGNCLVDHALARTMWPATRRAVLNEAIHAYTEALQEYPGDASTLGNRGAAYAHSSDYPRAIADQTAVLAATPNDVFALQNRAQAYKAQGMLREALGDYKAVLPVLGAQLMIETRARRYTAVQTEIAALQAQLARQP